MRVVSGWIRRFGAVRGLGLGDSWVCGVGGVDRN